MNQSAEILILFYKFHQTLSVQQNHQTSLAIHSSATHRKTLDIHAADYDHFRALVGCLNQHPM